MVQDTCALIRTTVNISKFLSLYCSFYSICRTVSFIISFLVKVFCIHRRLRFMPAAHHFRSQFLYNNYMYMLAGHVIERLTGSSWWEQTEKRILKPLGMTSTLTVEHLTRRNNRAKPHTSFSGVLTKLDEDILR